MPHLKKKSDFKSEERKILPLPRLWNTNIYIFFLSCIWETFADSSTDTITFIIFFLSGELNNFFWGGALTFFLPFSGGCQNIGRGCENIFSGGGVELSLL